MALTSEDLENPLFIHDGPLRRCWMNETFEIEASVQDVFAFLSAIDDWSNWVPRLRSVVRASDGPARVGTRFLAVVEMPVLQRVVTPCRIVRWDLHTLEWGAGPAWACVRHRFDLTPLGPTRTKVQHTERSRGPLALIFRPFEAMAHEFNRGWSRALQARFVRTAPALSARS